MKFNIHEHEHEHEVRHVVRQKDGCYNILYINKEQAKELTAKRHRFAELELFGIKRITATHAKYTKFGVRYNKLKIEFINDNRRYVTIPNMDVSVSHSIKAYQDMLKVWSQCINVLKAIESKNIVSVKQFIDDVGYTELVNCIPHKLPGMSTNMGNKVLYVQYLYKKHE